MKRENNRSRYEKVFRRERNILRTLSTNVPVYTQNLRRGTYKYYRKVYYYILPALLKKLDRGDDYYQLCDLFEHYKILLDYRNFRIYKPPDKNCAAHRWSQYRYFDGVNIHPEITNTEALGRIITPVYIRA